jgi:SRSO17 transposase
MYNNASLLCSQKSSLSLSSSSSTPSLTTTNVTALTLCLNNPAGDYQTLQYFFSESKWDEDKLNDKRVQILQRQPTTASTSSGILAIDDTGCPKPYAENTDGAKFQYCGPLKRNEVCNVSVVSAFVSSSPFLSLIINSIPLILNLY